MSDPQKSIFISYRRSVSSFIARAIFLELRSHDYDVFMDVENIDSGTFDTIILNQIAARAHVLVILTPGSLERCVEEGDWLRREIEEAIRLKRNIVPLFINNFDLRSAKEYLTGDLVNLLRYNGLNVPHDYFDAAMDKLRTRFLENAPVVEVAPTPASDEPTVLHKIEAVVRQLAPTVQDLSAENYFNRAYEQQESGEDVGQIIEDYSHAIRLKPDYAEAYNNRGLARARQGDEKGALRDFNDAIKFKPDYALAYNNRGLLYATRGDWTAAIQDYTRSIELKNPELHLPYLNRGVARAAQKDLANAIADYSAAIRAKPDYVSAYNNRGVSRQLQGDMVGALEDYSQAIAYMPTSVTAYFNRGLARLKQGDLDGALVDFSEVIRLQPDFPDAYSTRAEIYHKQNAVDLALRDYQRYLELGGGEKNKNLAAVERKIKELKGKL